MQVVQYAALCTCHHTRRVFVVRFLVRFLRLQTSMGVRLSLRV